MIGTTNTEANAPGRWLWLTTAAALPAGVVVEPASSETVSAEESAAGNGGITLVSYGYAWFSAERWPAGIAILSGTGMIVPAAW